VDVHSLAWSSDGRWIAFVSGNPTFVFGARPTGSEVNIGNAAPSSIWVVPARGGTAVRVTDSHSLNTSPVWLPGRRALLFVSNRAGERDVYRVDLGDDGRPLAAPLRLTTGLGAHTIALAADGRWLAYSVFRNTSNLWWIPIPRQAPVSPADARPLTAGSQVVEGIDVSPDGRWVAFDSDRSGNQDIYKISVDGGDPIQVTTDSADDFMPAWSPDGRQIAFHSFSDGLRRVEVVSADGGVTGPVIAAPKNQRFPGWSPDGRALVFSSDETGRMELYTVRRRADSAWERARKVTTAGGLNGRWSPDGRRIAYTTADGIWTIAAEGGVPHQILRVDTAAGPLIDVVQWGRDGRTLYYKAFDLAKGSGIWVVPADGGTPRLLVRFDDRAHQSNRPEFATDGRRLYFTMSEQKSDVWVMELITAQP
jgi:Tol biopolymer transport system component